MRHINNTSIISLLFVYFKSRPTHACQNIYLYSTNHLHVYCKPSKGSLQTGYTFLVVRLLVFSKHFSGLRKTRPLLTADHLRVKCTPCFLLHYTMYFLIVIHLSVNSEQYIQAPFLFYLFMIDHLFIFVPF